MWAALGVWAMGVASSLVGSALMRLGTRAFLFFSMLYMSEILLGNNPAADLIQMILNPNQAVQDFGEAAFGPVGIVSWGNFFIYLTDVWTPFRWFMTAAVSWWIVRQWTSLAK